MILIQSIDNFYDNYVERSKNVFLQVLFVNKIIYYVYIVLFLLLVALLIYYFIDQFFFHKKKRKTSIFGKNESFEPYQQIVLFNDLPFDISAGYTLNYNIIPMNSVANQISLCFWLKINDWYVNYGKWKHLYHRGNITSITETTTKCTDKNNNQLIYELFDEQYPGIWFNDQQNDIRIVFLCLPSNSISKHVIEFVDITNIIINQWFHLSIILNGKVVEIYINGLLHKTHILSNYPIENFNNSYFGWNHSLSGNLLFYHYFATSITPSDVSNIYNKERKKVNYYN